MGPFSTPSSVTVIRCGNENLVEKVLRRLCIHGQVPACNTDHIVPNPTAPLNSFPPFLGAEASWSNKRSVLSGLSSILWCRMSRRVASPFALLLAAFIRSFYMRLASFAKRFFSSVDIKMSRLLRLWDCIRSRYLHGENCPLSVKNCFSSFFYTSSWR